MSNEDVISSILTQSVRAEMKKEGTPAAETGRFSYTVTAADGQMTVRLILKKRLGFSSRLVAKIKREGTVTRNGVEVRLFADVIEGDVIDVKIPEERCYFEPQDIPIEAVYEDEDILVINKQPGVVVHPTRGHPTGTISNGLMKRMEERGEFFKIRFVNRLDRDTSGLLIVAKNSHSQDMLIKEMKSDRVDKRYAAIVHGIIKEDRGTIDLPIGRKNEGDIRRCVMEEGYPSVTHYKVIERFPAAGISFAELRLETGRTHQIRVHMSYIGHPLLGDTLYGLGAEDTEERSSDIDINADDLDIGGQGEAQRIDADLIGRQALHAKSLRFRMPVSGEAFIAEAELPQDMQSLLNRLREGGTS